MTNIWGDRYASYPHLLIACNIHVLKYNLVTFLSLKKDNWYPHFWRRSLFWLMVLEGSFNPWLAGSRAEGQSWGRLLIPCWPGSRDKERHKPSKGTAPVTRLLQTGALRNSVFGYELVGASVSTDEYRASWFNHLPKVRLWTQQTSWGRHFRAK